MGCETQVGNAYGISNKNGNFLWFIAFHTHVIPIRKKNIYFVMTETHVFMELMHGNY